MLYDYQVMQYVCTQPHDISLILQILLMILSKKQRNESNFVKVLSLYNCHVLQKAIIFLVASIIGLVCCQMVDAASFVLNEGLQKQGGSETLLEPHLAEIRNYVPSYILSGFAYKTLMEDPKSFWLYLKIPWKKISSVQNAQPYNSFERRDFQRRNFLIETNLSERILSDTMLSEGILKSEEFFKRILFQSKFHSNSSTWQ